MSELRYCGCGKHSKIQDPDAPKNGWYWIPECDTVICDECKKPNGYEISCDCWKSFSDMTLADIKAEFAAIDLSIEKELR